MFPLVISSLCDPKCRRASALERARLFTILRRHKRRIPLFTLNVALLILDSELQSLQNPRSIKLDGQLRKYVTFASVTNILNDRMFRRAFRMDRAVFDKLLSLIHDDLKRRQDGSKGETTNNTA